MENKLDQLFRNQLSKHEEEPTPQSWEQLEEMLTSKKRAMWAKRLAIAASITVFAAASFFAYRSLIIVSTGPAVEIVKTESNSIDKQSLSNDSQVADKVEVPDVTEEETDVQPALPIDELEQSSTSHVAKVAETKTMTKEENERIQDEHETMAIVAGVAEAEVGTDLLDKEEAEGLEAMEKDVTPEDLESPILAENTTGPQIIETTTAETEDGDLPKVQIVYKANKGSALVASSKSTIIDKGLNKITEFSNEHLLTADRKTRLRNTKNDLLALNFGKLLNKSNRELEN